MLFLYNLCWFFFFPLAFLFYPLIFFMSGKKRSGLLQNFGFIRLNKSTFSDKKVIWLQAVSVGELATALPIINELKKSIHNLAYVVSVTTEAGYERAKDFFPDALEIFYSPLDFYPIVSRVLRKINPVAIVIIETGFWPNLLSCGSKIGSVPLLVNGRISEKSFRNYQRISPVAKWVFNFFKIIITRDATVSERLKKIGVEKKKIISFGDVKYDTLPVMDENNKEFFKKIFSVGPETRILMAGNTHEGEEEFLLDIFDELRKRFTSLILIIAPRRLERVSLIEKMLSRKGRNYDKRTRLDSDGTRKANIVLLDTIGELSKIYFACDIIFVGKSIFSPGGGHSLLEPVAAGKIAFHGPFVQYYEEAKGLLQKEGLAVELSERSDFIESFSDILANEEKNREILKRAEIFLNNRKGASIKTAEVIKKNISY